MYDNINKRNQITDVKKSAAKLIQNFITKKLAVRIIRPIVVKLEVYRFRLIFPLKTSLSCGNRIKPNAKLTEAIIMSCILGEYPKRWEIISVSIKDRRTIDYK